MDRDLEMCKQKKSKISFPENQILSSRIPGSDVDFLKGKSKCTTNESTHINIIHKDKYIVINQLPR